MKDPKSFIENLELIDIDSKFYLSDYSMFESDTATPSFVNFKSVNSFSENVSKQSQEDVLNSMLLAQRAASKAYPEESQIGDWYTLYFKVLEKIGWLISNKDVSSLGEKTNGFEIDKAIFSLLTDFLTGQQINILRKSLEALRSLGDNDKRLVAFEHNTVNHNRGNFQLGLAEENNGNVSVLGSGFVLESQKKITKILFLKFDKNIMTVKLNFFKAELISSKYAENRQFVIDKLGNAKDYIASLDV